MARDVVIQRLKENGCRITKQRLMLLDIILKEDVNTVEEIGVVTRQIRIADAFS